MLSALRISPRERLVLLAIIETYIATGEPVASQSLARLYAHKDGMSSATIRNVMASLGEAGLLDQAHSSAGRIPTPLAFRFYVEQLGTRELAGAVASQGAVAQLSVERRAEIEESFQGVSSAQQFLERTSQVLASVSSGLGIALLAASDTHALEHIHFSRLGAGRVLAVLVTTAGVVLDRVLQLTRELQPAELDASARYLNDNFRGWAVDRIHAELEERRAAEQNAYDRLLRSVEELCEGGALQKTGRTNTVFIGGVGNLLASEMDRTMLRQMLTALEEKQRLVALLSAYVDARQQTVRVVVGLEGDLPDLPEMSNFVLIGAPTRLGRDHSGTLAVIAPTRVQYARTIETVAFLAQLSDRILQLPQP
jgi:heat-inducible transcriptional repressor